MTYTQHQAKLGLNIAPIKVPDTTIQAGVFAYDPDTGHTELAELRQKHRGTHAIARRGNRIVCLPRVAGAPTVGHAQEELSLRQNLSLAAALLRETLIDHFHNLPRPVIGHRPIAFLGANDLLRAAVPAGLSVPPWLTLLPRYEVDVRLFFFAKQDPFLGIALDSRTRRRVTASCAELIADGIRLQGLYVGRMRPEDDTRQPF
jgi:hypothetical protein